MGGANSSQVARAASFSIARDTMLNDAARATCAQLRKNKRGQQQCDKDCPRAVSQYQPPTSVAPAYVVGTGTPRRSQFSVCGS